MSSWLFYALLSAIFAAFVSIFGKIGLSGLDSSAATAVRAVIEKLSVVFAVMLAVLIFHEKVSLMHAIAIGLIAIGGLMLAIF